MIEMQIAMTVADPAVRGASVEHAAVPRQKLVGVARDGIERELREAAADKLERHLEIVLDVMSEVLDGGNRGFVREWWLCFVEAFEGIDEAIDVPGGHAFLVKQPFQNESRIQFPHLHCPLDDRAFISEMEAPVALADSLEAEVNVLREPAVQFDLAFAISAAQFEGRKIEEPKVHRLLHLVDERRGNKDP